MTLKVSAFDSIDDLPATFAASASYAQLGETFLCAEWLRCIYTTALEKSMSARIYAATANDSPRGLLACGIDRETKVLRSLTNYYSQDYRPTLLSGLFSEMAVSDRSLAEFINATVDAIAGERPRWSQLEFEYLRSDRSDSQFLRSALRRHGFISIASRQYENWYLTCDGLDFDAYFAQRSSQLRNTITRKEKKIKKSHALEIKIYTRNDEELTKAVAEYNAIYNSSWKNPEPFPDFIPTFARMCADLGTLRMGVAYLDGQAAAAQFWIVSNARALIYKLAYAEQFAELSVGSVLSRELFRHALDVDRVKEIDYGIGSEPYKREWMNSVRQFNRLSAYNLASFVGASRLARRACLAAFKRIAKK